MTASSANAARREQGNSLALPLLGAVPARQEAGNLVAGEWLLPLVAKASDRCMSRKEAAILLGLSEPELSKQLAGVDGKSLNIRRFGALGDAVLIAFVDELRCHFKLDDPSTRIQQAMDLVSRGMSMLVKESQR